MKRFIVATLLLFTSLAYGGRAYVISPLQALVADGTGGAIEVGAPAGAYFFQVTVTAGSGTVSEFRVYLEGTVNRIDWAELPCDSVLKSGIAAPGAATLNQRDIVNETAVVPAANYVCLIKSLGVDVVRARWVIQGTSPSETFRVQGRGQ